MSAKHGLLALVVLLATPFPLHAEPLDAPTGEYAGTLVHVRRLRVLNTDPPRVVSFKKKTKVAGFGTVRVGEARTYILLIAPPGAQSDAGLDRELILNFNPDPPTFTVVRGGASDVVGSPTITVDGKVVTVSTELGSSDSTIAITDTTTLVLKLKKPL